MGFDPVWYEAGTGSVNGDIVDFLHFFSEESLRETAAQAFS